MLIGPVLDLFKVFSIGTKRKYMLPGDRHGWSWLRLNRTEKEYVRSSRLGPRRTLTSMTAGGHFHSVNHNSQIASWPRFLQYFSCLMSHVSRFSPSTPPALQAPIRHTHDVTFDLWRRRASF